MSEWKKPRDLEALLDAARGEGPSPERLARVEARLEAALGASLGSSAGSPPASRPPAAPRSVSTLVVGLTTAAALAVALWLFARREPPVPTPLPVEVATEPAPSPSPPPLPSPSPGPEEGATVSPAPSPAVAPIVEHAVGAPAVPADRAPREGLAPEPPRDEPGVAAGASVEPGSTLREEIALLERAMSARDAGDLLGARTALELHRSRFPAGILGPERERLLGELPSVPVAPGPEAPDPSASP